MKKFLNSLSALAFWICLLLLLWFLVCGCKRRPRVDPQEDIPDLPKDTVYVPRVVSRCNYQYLSANPKIAEKQLKEAVRQLDLLIAEYDTIIREKTLTASIQIRKINQLRKDEKNCN